MNSPDHKKMVWALYSSLTIKFMVTKSMWGPDSLYQKIMVTNDWI